MMTFTPTKGQRRLRSLTAMLLGGVFSLSWIGDCGDRFIDFTGYVDPCGTILGNCQPGDFATDAADVGDYCIDPACTVPGGCGNVGPALGTTTDLCP